MTPQEVYEELEERLLNASKTLRQMAHDQSNDRLLHKAQGVSLALDYLRSYRVYLENHDA